MTLTQRIKELADSKKVTFAEIERAVGLSNGQIRRWDKASPRVENLQKVANYLGVDVSYLIGSTQNDSKSQDLEPDDYEKSLLMMFRKGEQAVPDDKKDVYRKQALEMMDFIASTMKDLDEKNKPK